MKKKIAAGGFPLDDSSLGIIQAFSFLSFVIFLFFWSFRFICSAEVKLNTYVLVQVLSFTRTASAIESTTKHQTQLQKRKPIQQARSNHKDKESV